MNSDWPALPLEAWQETYATLHMWTQIVGKVRLAQTPWINHSWHVTFYPTARGLTTSPIPHGTRLFQIDFDFLDHRLLLQAHDGNIRTVPLKAQSVAVFYGEVMDALNAMDLPVRIDPRPCETLLCIPFEQDHHHAHYDADAAQRWWRALLQSARVMQRFRSRFIGKCSPVHFFWGSFDLAVTRFSGRAAAPHPGGIPHLADRIVQEAYSHEVSSCGFWPGGEQAPFPLFYAYAYPEPAGFTDRPIRPDAAYYDPTLHEFVLPYEVVRLSPDPDALLLEFLQSSYEAAADLGDWDRRALEM